MFVHGEWGGAVRSARSPDERSDIRDISRCRGCPGFRYAHPGYEAEFAAPPCHDRSHHHPVKSRVVTVYRRAGTIPYRAAKAFSITTR
jgi:hypothetical protein